MTISVPETYTYLDWAATTPLCEEAAQAMAPFLAPGLANVGLGMNAKKDDFRQQYVGKSGELAVNKDGGEIVAITSATVTSRAVTKAVNEALALYESVAGKGE